MHCFEKTLLWLIPGRVEPPSREGGKLPPFRILARVISVSGDQALLSAQGITFKARLEAFVTAGETLLLEHKGRLESPGYFRIVARAASPGANEPGEISRELICALIQGHYLDSDTAYPVLLHHHSEGGRQPVPAGETLLFDLYLETEHLGLVMLRLCQQGAGYGCRILVENEKAGAALEEEARRILAGRGKRSGAPEAAPLQWAVCDLLTLIASALDLSRAKRSLSALV